MLALYDFIQIRCVKEANIERKQLELTDEEWGSERCTKYSVFANKSPMGMIKHKNMVYTYFSVLW